MGTLGTNAVSININKDVEKYTEESILQALEMIGLKAESYAKMKCPVDTGLLRNSIAHAVGKGEYTVYVGTNVEYAPYVEMGHIQAGSGKHVAPQPYIKPAIVDHLDEYKQILENTLKEE